MTVVTGAAVVLGGFVVVGTVVLGAVVAVTVLAVVVVTTLAVVPGELPEPFSDVLGSTTAVFFGTVLVEPFLPVGLPAESSRKLVVRH